MIFQKLFNNGGPVVSLDGLYFRESFSLKLSKLLTPFSVEDVRWSESVIRLECSNDHNDGWISILVDADENTLQNLKEKIGNAVCTYSR